MSVRGTDAVDLTEEELEELLKHTDCAARVDMYTSVIVEIETVAFQAFLADDMKLANALRAVARDFRLKLDPLAAQLRAHINRAVTNATVKRKKRDGITA